MPARLFISSVTHLSKEERAALAPFLRLLAHDPLRSEDFEVDRSSREACRPGFEAADVYVLLPGPHMGHRFSISSVPDGGGVPERSST
ncbi:DUF4062 domain-containing protein [Mycolicibacterium novocastrense]|uniref:DUF4062 domain-containing protein n=1 Tax=Mycolicibacterium novocastrense TaxID=59813 RepID=UPI0009EBEB37